jgi:simple sugar transport system ATP-binding protein
MTEIGKIAIEAHDIAKRYGAVVALESVDFECRYGKVVGLVGDNGAGKSTLIKTLVGVEQPDRGRLVIEGTERRWANAAEARSWGVETVFQDLALCNHLSVWRNFFLRRELRRFGSSLGPLDGKRMRAIVTDALADFGLHVDSVNVPVQNLSGGERQGVAIARAVHFGARVLVMDEPTNALSVVETEKVLDSVARAVRAGLAVIIISHTLAYVHDLADEIFVVQHGRCVSRAGRGDLSLRELEEIVAGRREGPQTGVVV